MANKFSPSWRSRERSRLSLPRTATFRAALCYPNTYTVGMSSLGLHAIYHACNSRPDMRCERIFSDTVGRGTYRSVESERPIAGFDIVAISVSYELDCASAAAFVRAIAPNPQSRPVMPLVIIGGVLTSINFRPLIPFADLIVVGEAEESLASLLDLLARHGVFQTRRQKERFLAAAAVLPGVFVPGLTSSPDVPPARIRDVDAYPTSSQIITPHTEFSNTFLIELSRGCPRQCAFCVMGAAGGAFRPRTLERLLPELEAGLSLTDTVGLVAAAVSDYPRLTELCAWLRQRRARITVSSLRAESTSEEVLRSLALSGQHSVTFAPETGSESLRRRLRKTLSNEALLEQCRRSRDAGMRSVKLYFMIGLPGETNADLEALVQLSRACRRIIPLKLNIGIFVPKPHTELARAPFAGRRDLKQKQQQLRRLLHPTGIPARLASIREAEQEYRITQADETVLLRETWRGV